jgi:urease accessory protein
VLSQPVSEVAPTWAGLASLTFGVRDGCTRLVQCRVRPPLLVQRTLYLDDALPDLATAFLVNPTAGILAGDQQTIEVDVGPASRARVCTQAATKVFAMPGGGAGQQVSLNVQEGAYLEYLPDAVIPFRDACFSQVTAITVAPGATLVFGEIVAPGRVEMGEVLAYRQFRSRLTVNASQGGPLYREAFALEPGSRLPRGIGVMGRWAAPTLGTLLVLNYGLDLERLRDGMRRQVEQWPEQGLTVDAGVSLLPNDIGVGLKVVGEPAWSVARALRSAWSVARLQILGVDLPPLRR